MASFGYAKEKMWVELNRKLDQEIRQEALRLGVTDDFSIEVSGQLDPDVRPAERDPLNRGGSPERIREFKEWLKGLKKRQQDLLADYYHQHGFRLNGKVLLVDYQGIAARATPALKDCFRALNAVLAEPSQDEERSELFLRFFQQVRYEIPNRVDRQGRQTHGFRVPVAVMTDGSGDCDSKAAALSALWRNYPKQVLVLLRDGAKHALVALEETPNDPDVQRIGNHYYRVGEVVAKENLPPEILESKDKELWYTCIRPVGQSEKVSCP
ncbi:MAG TPA: hypothetical protein VJ725_26735 [Thermoanaerobaculia bacterium]|nr:hypothetical protein [Thermoanaerobaculia bacterium]